MKTIILLLLSFNLFAGELHWYTNGYQIESRLDCQLYQSIFSDENRVNQFYLNCGGSEIERINLQDSSSMSFVFVNSDFKFLCPIEIAYWKNEIDFYIYLNCNDDIFKGGFE